MISTRIRTLIKQQWAGIIALFLALSGGVAWASHPGGANTINSVDIIDGQVKEADVGQGAVASPEVKDGSVLPGDVAPNSLTSGRIADGSLTGTDVANNSLKGVDIDESTLSSIGGGGPAGGDLTGSYPNPLVAPDAVGSGEISNAPSGSDDVNADTLDGRNWTDFVSTFYVVSRDMVMNAGEPDVFWFSVFGAQIWVGCSASQTKVRYRAAVNNLVVWRDNGGGDAEVFRPAVGDFIPDAVNGNADNLGEMLTFVSNHEHTIFVAAVRETGPEPDVCRYQALAILR